LTIDTAASVWFSRRAGRPTICPAAQAGEGAADCLAAAEVLQLIAEGKASQETAAEPGISTKIVGKHRENLMSKLNIHDTAGVTPYPSARASSKAVSGLTLIQSGDAVQGFPASFRLFPLASSCAPGRPNHAG
jgi:hypothetical protein